MSAEVVSVLEANGWRFGEPDADGFYAPTVALFIDVERLAAVVESIDMGMYWREEPRQPGDAPGMKRMRFMHRAYAERIAQDYRRGATAP